MMAWSTSDIPDQQDRIVVVTGANSGLGLETTKALIKAKATVVIACRDVGSGERAAQALPSDGTACVIGLDLTNIGSIRSFADQVIEAFGHIDLLINNAGVLAPAARPKHPTPAADDTNWDRLDRQWLTNHLGHFALTGLLLPAFVERAARIVNVSSLAAGGGNPDQMIRSDGTVPGGARHRRFQTYRNTKWANLVFALELNHRLAAAGSRSISVAAHPGISHTNLASSIGLPAALTSAVSALSARFAQSAADGALPTLRAATDPCVEGGQYYGPAGPKQRTGPPKQVAVVAGAATRAHGRELWERSIAITGVRYLTGH